MNPMIQQYIKEHSTDAWRLPGPSKMQSARLRVSNPDNINISII